MEGLLLEDLLLSKLFECDSRTEGSLKRLGQSLAQQSAKLSKGNNYLKNRLLCEKAQKRSALHICTDKEKDLKQPERSCLINQESIWVCTSKVQWM